MGIPLQVQAIFIILSSWNASQLVLYSLLHLVNGTILTVYGL